MFVEQSAINEILNCKVCESKLKDPRLLPCGQSTCAECIYTLADEKKERIKCKDCGKVHEIPRDGFPENKALVELAKLKSNEVSRCQTIAEIKSILEKISVISLKLETGLEIGETTIRNKCDEARNDVQLTIEEAHLELDKLHKTYMDEIDSYERECHTQLKTLQNKSTDEIVKVLAETKNFQGNSIPLLTKNELDASKLQIIFDDGKKLLRKIQKVDDRLEANLLCNKHLYFEKHHENITTKTLGEIKTYAIQGRFGKDDSTLNHVDLSAHLNDLDIGEVDFYTFCFLQDESIFMAYVTLNSKVNMYLFDRQGNLLKKNEASFEVNDESPYLESTTINNMIYLSNDKRVNKDQYECELRRIDASLNVKKKIGFIGDCKIFAKSDELLTYDQDDDVVRKRDLLDLKRKENEAVTSYDNSLEVTSFFELDDHVYVIASNGKVTLAEACEYGRVWYKFEIDFCQESPNCFPYLNSYIAAHEQSSKKVYFYSIDNNGQIDDEASLERLPAQVTFIGTCKDMLFFFDKNEKKIYYF